MNPQTWLKLQITYFLQIQWNIVRWSTATLHLFLLLTIELGRPVWCRWWPCIAQSCVFCLKCGVWSAPHPQNESNPLKWEKDDKICSRRSLPSKSASRYLLCLTFSRLKSRDLEDINNQLLQSKIYLISALINQISWTLRRRRRMIKMMIFVMDGWTLWMSINHHSCCQDCKT